MTLSDWGIVAEIVGATATVAALVYLAIQVRQQNLQLREELRFAKLQTSDSVFDSFSRWRTLLIEPANAEFLLKGPLDPDSLSQVEHLRFDALMSELFYAAGNFVNRQKQGLYISDQETFNQQLSTISDFLRTPGGAKWWLRRKAIFGEELSETVDAALNNQ